MTIESMEERQARYEQARKARVDGLTIREIGVLLGVSHQRAASILKNGPPKPIGRPRKKKEAASG